MSCYSHLTIEERECLMLSLEKGQSIRQIAKKLGRAPSTISRELRRTPGPYRASVAQKQYHRNRSRCKRRAILEDRELHKLVRFLLGYLWWSPEQISNRLKEENTAQISTSTIYRGLDNGLLQDTLRYYLRIKYKKIGKAKDCKRICFQRSISLRPESADMRSEHGHWEGDTVRGSRENDAVVTLVDRYSRFLLCEKVPNRESGTVRRAVVKLLKQSRLPVHSVTFDQGTEFAESLEMEQELGVGVYFAHPMPPGSVPQTKISTV